MKIKYFFIFLIALYFFSSFMNYNYNRRELKAQKTQIKNLEQELQLDSVRLDSLKLLTNDFERLDSLLSIAIKNKKNLTSEELKTQKEVIFKKHQILKKKQKNAQEQPASITNPEISQDSENQDSLKKEKKSPKQSETDKDKTTSLGDLSNKKIKRVYSYNNINGLVSLGDPFIKVKYNPNNDELVNSMIDKPSKVKINNKYVILTSLTEYYNEKNRAHYVLTIRVYKKDLKLGANKITVVDNISREHTTIFQVTN